MKNLKLRDYPTLAHVIRFAQEKRPDLASAADSSTPKGEAIVAGDYCCHGGYERYTSGYPRSRAGSPACGYGRRKEAHSGASGRENSAIPKICWIWNWTWKPISESTR